MGWFHPNGGKWLAGRVEVLSSGIRRMASGVYIAFRRLPNDLPVIEKPVFTRA